MLEDQEGAINCKFGVIFAKEGQTSDVQMLANNDTSPEFEQFLTLLGTRIQLSEWGNYKGGLDTASESVKKLQQKTCFFLQQIPPAARVSTQHSPSTKSCTTCRHYYPTAATIYNKSNASGTLEMIL